MVKFDEAITYIRTTKGISVAGSRAVKSGITSSCKTSVSATNERSGGPTKRINDQNLLPVLSMQHR